MILNFPSNEATTGALGIEASTRSQRTNSRITIGDMLYITIKSKANEDRWRQDSALAGNSSVLTERLE